MYVRDKEQEHETGNAGKEVPVQPRIQVQAEPPRLPGHPDIVLRKYRTVIFVNGCFWHGHENCKSYVLPKSNTGFWKNKIERNRNRDMEERQKLSSMGWHSITVWECHEAESPPTHLGGLGTHALPYLS